MRNLLILYLPTDSLSVRLLQKIDRSISSIYYFLRLEIKETNECSLSRNFVGDSVCYGTLQYVLASSSVGRRSVNGCFGIDCDPGTK